MKSIGFGLLLFVASCFLVVWNEGRTARTAAALSQGEGAVVPVASDRLDPAREGALVHVAGAVTLAEAARDADFNLASDALVLVRKVEMFQWKETPQSRSRNQPGGGADQAAAYLYQGEWSEAPIDSSRFRDAINHRNPPMPTTKSRVFVARDARLGAFSLDERALKQLAADNPLEPPATILTEARARFGNFARIAAGVVQNSLDPTNPSIGDVRVTWKIATPASLSLVGRQTGAFITPWIASNGEEVLRVEGGVLDARAMFQRGQDENSALAWVMRFTAIIAMLLGFRLMMSWLVTIASFSSATENIVAGGAWLTAFVLTAIVAPLLIAIAWIAYRPLVAIVVLAAGGTAALVAHRFVPVKNDAARTSGGRKLPGAAP